MQSARYSRSLPVNEGSCKAARAVPGGNTARTRATTPSGSSKSRPATLAGRSDIVAIGLVATEIVRVGEPLDRFHEPTLEAFAAAVLRTPAHGLLGLLDAGKQAFDLTGLRAQSLGIGFDVDVCADYLGDQLGGVADRHLESRADVDLFPHHALRDRGANEGVDSVRDIQEIARRMQSAELELTLAREELRCDGGNHRACRLPWPECVEGPQHHD